MRNLLLPQWCINQFRDAVQQDQAEPTERKREDRKHFRNTTKDILCVIVRLDPGTFPIYLDCLTFAIFTRLMNTRKKQSMYRLKRLMNSVRCQDTYQRVCMMG